MNSTSNNGRIWRWRKVDVLFIVGLAMISYGIATHWLELIIAGGGLSGIPLTQRGDKS
jgi:hypothetical protein